MNINSNYQKIILLSIGFFVLLMVMAVFHENGILNAYRFEQEQVKIKEENEELLKKIEELDEALSVANAKNKNASKVTPTPRGRPVITNGVTRRIRTGEGSLYITINEDQEGLCEVFTTIGCLLYTSPSPRDS